MSEFSLALLKKTCFIFALTVSTGVAAQEPATFDCVIDPSLTLKLGSPISSVLETVNVDRGDHVRKGDVVARLTSRVEEAVVALNEAKARSAAELDAKKAVLEQKRGVWERKSTLQKRAIGSTQDVDTALAEFRVAEQEVALAELNRELAGLELQRSRAALEDHTIRSPIDGVILQRSLGPGEYVRQDAYVVSVAQLDPLHVEAFLPVRYYGALHVGDVAHVRPDAGSGESRPAAISVIDALSDAASGTFGVRLKLPNPDLGVPAGFRCQVTFDIATRVETTEAGGDVGRKP